MYDLSEKRCAVPIPLCSAARVRHNDAMGSVLSGTDMVAVYQLCIHVVSDACVHFGSVFSFLVVALIASLKNTQPLCHHVQLGSAQPQEYDTATPWGPF